MADQDFSQSPRPEPVDLVFVLGIVSLILVIGTWGVLTIMGAGRAKQSLQYDNKIKELDSKILALKDTEQTYLAVESSLTHAKRLRDTRYLFGPTWTMVRDNVPKDVQFTSLSLGNDSTVRIVGSTKSVTSVAQFARQLEKQKGITMVTPLSLERSPNNGQYGFTLSFKVAEQTEKGAQ